MGHEDVFKGIISKSAKNIVKSIDVIPASLTLKPGEIQQLKVMATMGDDSKKDITKTIDGTKYTIPVENMAQIDENGLLTIPKNAEEGTINILIENQGIKQTLNLIVEKDHSNEMKSIEVTPNQAKVKTGQSQQLKVEATMGDNSKKDITSGAGTTYKSSDETMATVDDKGLVKVANNAKIGNVKIAINNGNFSDVVIITTEPIDPNKIIKIDAVPNKFTVKAGQTQQLKIMATMATGDEKEITSDGDITYRSLNENNVTVSKTGLVTVNPNVKLGNTLIVVSKGDQAINVIITTEPVEEIKMTKITATPNEMTLKPGQTQKLKVIATMSDGKENDITEDAVITYKSINQKVATVDNKGLVTIPNDAIAGTSVITITKDNMSVDVRVTAEVIDPNKLVKIEAVPNKLKVKAGQNAQLKIMATMGDKSEKEVTSDEDVTYKSLNEDAVTVSKTGLVTVNPNAKLGNTVIVVTKGNESINVVITTELDDSNKIMKIEANPNKFKLKAGETQQLKIMATLGDGKQKEITLDNNTKYKSLDENAVTVNKAGLVTVNPSVKLGNTIIEVVNGDQAINVIISTEPVEEIKMTKITATPNEMILKPGQTQKLKVIATMSDGKENDITEDAAITYKSMNQKVATVDNKGLVTIPNDAIAGTSIITITKDNMSVEVRVTAEVIDPNKLVKIEAVPNKFKVKAGETVQLKIMATMGDKSEKEVTSDDDITYKSLNENVLTVSKTGLVTVNPNAKLGNSLIEVTKGNESINVVITTEPYDPNKIMKIESNPNKFKLKAGETQQLKIMATLGDGKQKEITLDNNTTYKSLNENAVNVSKAGLVTVNPSAKLGNTIIEVVNGDQAINVIISTEPVEEIKITKITVTPKETKLKPGQTQKLKVMATMSDSSEKEITEDAGVIYISTKEKVATVDNKGLVSIPNDAIAGTSIITITKDNMSVEVRITAEVIDPNKLVKIEAVPNKLKVKAGETAQLKIMGTMEDKSEKEVTSDDDITYKSLNENAVTVSKTGLVTVNPNAKLGNVLIEVTKGNQGINVVIATEPYDPNKIMKIESNPNKFKLKAGETQQLKIMATLGDGKQKEITLDNNTTYKSLNENVVTISKNGLVTVNPSAKLGNTIIEVVNGDQAINVIIGTEPVEEIRITKITVTPNETKLKPGQTQKLKVMATMSDSSEKEITEDAGVTYISTKEKVATVDNKGLVSIPNDAIAGTSIITITKDNISVEVRITAEVVDPNKLVKIEAVPSKLTVKAGETVQLKIMGTMGDKSEKEVTSDDDIIYRSLNEKVVTVSKTGLVTVNPNAKLGNSLIEVIKGNQGINVVIATEPDNSGKITKIESVPSKLTVKAGQTQQLKIMGTTGDGKQKEVTLDDDVTYESLNENIVTVSKTGLVKVNQNAKLGNTIIVVRKGDLAINVIIATQPVIPDKVVQLIATPNSPILTAGETQQLKITAVLDDGNTKDVTGDDKISYTSYNENMVTVSKTGLVTVNKNAKNGRVLIVVTKGDVGLNVVITTKAN